ncbi:MAG: 2-oxoacid:acceptor oxidoreductase family protein, partial [bacterium]
MVEIRFHGRGGQGAVLASRVLAAAAFLRGGHVQAFPAFGLERRGAPVLAFTRIDKKPILIRNQIYTPDCAVVLDASLLKLVNVTEGLKPGGWVVVNTDKSPAELPGLVGFSVAAVNASEIAQRHGLGSRVMPIVNTAILGAFARATGVVALEDLERAIRDAVHIKP